MMSPLRLSAVVLLSDHPRQERFHAGLGGAHVRVDRDLVAVAFPLLLETGAEILIDRVLLHRDPGQGVQHGLVLRWFPVTASTRRGLRCPGASAEYVPS